MQSTRYSCPNLMKLEFSGRIFEKYADVKGNENPSIGCRVVPFGPTDRQADGDMTKITVAFHSFAKNH
jgi:hypothetical protein